jgi:hypothetical protein
MTKLRTLAAFVILSAAIASPVFAADNEGGGPIGPGSRYGLTPQPWPTYHAYDQRRFHGAYNQWNGRYDSGDRDREPPWLRSAHGG